MNSLNSTTSKLVKPTDDHNQALKNMRDFLREKTCYDILPESYRLIVFDNSLGIKRALTALMTNGVVSAPLYDSTSFKFCGMFTLTDVIHLIQYFYLKALPNQYNLDNPSASSSATSSPLTRVTNQIESHANLYSSQRSTDSTNISNSPLDDPYALAAAEIESFPLSRLRDIEQAIDAPPPPTVHVHPDAPLLDAFEHSIRTHARRIPLIDSDTITGKDAILCAQSDVERLTQSIGSLGIGSYASSFQSEGSNLLPTDENNRNPFHPLATATLQTTVFDAVHMFSERGISAVPIIDEYGSVIDMYEAIDIVDLVRTDAYRLLDLTIAEAIARRSPEFCGVTVCSAEDSLANILKYIRDRRVHRFVIVEDEVSVVEEVEESEDEDATPLAEASPPKFDCNQGENQRKGKRKKTRVRKVKDRLVGMLSLSDIMKHVVGNKQKSLQGKSIVGLGSGEKGNKDKAVQRLKEVEEEEEGRGGATKGMGASGVSGKLRNNEDEVEEDSSMAIDSEDIDEEE
ncbi:hypothetical protein PPACK8108_LOCUS23240 [Phakopsora pachyrhizi]|uniref:CBS domain-containing protein n=1 Tax=Phakopsora pachyrhizi TaxID=170000 RepID=A0AAV0BQI0_PHAPC|nr:hypothetical protein PPACK8108_LOCUS23240 [Phakopsora pachyrhizi]